MPTKNPRLTITLEPSLAAQLRRLSQLTGNSQAALISQLLAGSGAVFDRLITVLEAAEDARWSMVGSVSEDLHQAQQRIEQQLGLVLDGREEDVARPILEEAEKVHRRRTRARPTSAGPAAVATPLSNRGVRSGRKTAKKPTGSRG
jgi:hypothetical protein